MNAKEPAVSDSDVDPDDAPEWTDEEFARADRYENGRLVRPGLSPSGEPKVKLDEVWLSPDVAARLQSIPSWQTVLDSTLRAWLDQKLVRRKPEDEARPGNDTPAQAAE